MNHAQHLDERIEGLGLVSAARDAIELWKQYVQNLIRDKKFAPKHDVLVLDGIPRSRNQAKALDPFIKVLRVVHLTAPNIDEMVGRMKKRALKENRPDDADESVIRRR